MEYYRRPVGSYLVTVGIISVYLTQYINTFIPAQYKPFSYGLAFIFCMFVIPPIVYYLLRILKWLYFP